VVGAVVVGALVGLSFTVVADRAVAGVAVEGGEADNSVRRCVCSGERVTA